LELPQEAAHLQEGERGANLLPDGRVFVDGQLWFVVDRLGRVFLREKKPFAVLMRDGRLLGRDDRLIGRIFDHRAALPHDENNLFGLGENGTVVDYQDGEPKGAWRGCDSLLRTCTLVTYLVDVVIPSLRPPPMMPAPAFH
jgi:hypothetical protein